VFPLLSPSEICGRQSGSGTNFRPITSVFPAPYLFSTTCFSYHKDKSVKPGNLSKAMLFRNGEYMVENILISL
jgi:hypothetical protein